MPNPLGRERRLPFDGPAPRRAAGFTGAFNQYLEHADNAALSMGVGGVATFALWVYPELSGAAQVLLAKDGGTAPTREYSLRLLVSGLVEFSLSDGTTASTLNGARALLLNTWQLVVATYDGASLGVSLNRATATTTAKAGTGDIQNGTNVLRLGLRSDGNVQPLTGRLDMVGFWKRLLSGAEIGALWNEGRGRAYAECGPALLATLVAWWDLDDAGGSGATWVEQRNGHHLTAGTGTAQPQPVAGKR